MKKVKCRRPACVALRRHPRRCVSCGAVPTLCAPCGIKLTELVVAGHRSAEEATRERAKERAERVRKIVEGA
jgi:hypothetical protein